MRILVDTNILFSAIIFPLSVPAHALKEINDNHELVLCSQNIEELREITRRKKPELLPDMEVLLAELSYELIPAIDKASAAKLLRDPKDQPILNAAIVENVDIIITGDKDFLEAKLETPRCITCSEFLSQNLNDAA